MATKRKPTTLTERIKSRPRGLWITLGGVAAVLGVFTSIWPFMPKFQTVAAAELHEKEDAKRAVELSYGQARLETFILRSQVNDCMMRSARQVDKAVCDGYRREYEQANQRMEAQYKQTLKPEK